MPSYRFGGEATLECICLRRPRSRPALERFGSGRAVARRARRPGPRRGRACRDDEGPPTRPARGEARARGEAHPPSPQTPRRRIPVGEAPPDRRAHAARSGPSSARAVRDRRRESPCRGPPRCRRRRRSGSSRRTKARRARAPRPRGPRRFARRWGSCAPCGRTCSSSSFHERSTGHFEHKARGRQRHEERLQVRDLGHDAARRHAVELREGVVGAARLPEQLRLVADRRRLPPDAELRHLAARLHWPWGP